MRALDLNFARAARIFDPNFMRVGRKPARPRDKILSRERLLRGDEILNGGGILSDRALNVGEILSGSGIFSSGKIWSDSKILNGGGILRDCEISSGSVILNLTSRGGTRRGFFRWILRKLRGEASPLRLLRKFQSANGSQIDYKFKRAVALQTDRKFKMAVGLRVACKFKIVMQKFHHRTCTAVELLRQKFRSETMPRCIKFQSPPYAIKRSKFQGAMSKMGAGSRSALLKFQISVAALSQLKFRGVPNAITRLKFQGAIATAAFAARLKFGGSSRAAQRRKIRAQGQGG
ncbi:hypothetical protein [uncultured Campylobacter sp.]|jgi:hypothetical protein|uniref:hypothetical protein n=1 Tax=uncultured Campylobacter sp. TaxID=218934 RepID=UPI002637C9A1|nr:hypothetical protein [uncultured Campylobacter sp.]